MPVPAAVSQWVHRTYPRPKVDEEWLLGCYDYITDEDPTRTMEQIISCVEEHLLLSDLSDSMLPNTGLPANVSTMKHEHIKGSPILVEVISMTEIGHSAFNLLSVRQTRIDRADLAGLDRGDEDEEEGYKDPDDEAPIPPYPRSMLKLFLSDGSVTIPAIEYARIPALVLGETPLGSKMLLKDVLIRQGMAFLEPGNVIFKGHQTEERVVNQDRDFIVSLKTRMGLEVDETDLQPQGQPQNPPQAPAQNLPQNSPPPMNRRSPTPASPRGERPPFREISAPPEPSATLTNHEDDANVALRRRVPTAHHKLNPPSLDDATVEERRSRHFPSQASSSKTLVNPSAPIAQARVFSPLRSRPSVIEIPSSPENSPTASSSKLADDMQPKEEPLFTQRAESSDYGGDDDMFMDPDFLAQIAKVEAEALEDERHGTAPVAAPSTSTPTTSQSSNAAVDIIMIEDNDDKENIPINTRRVRRRPAPTPSQANPGDVIDISD